jgi:choline dehydrogenase-like flavoprotein
MDRVFEVIIVGGESAGCVMANRLSARSDREDMQKGRRTEIGEITGSRGRRCFSVSRRRYGLEDHSDIVGTTRRPTTSTTG